MRQVVDAPRRVWLFTYPALQCPRGHAIKAMANTLASATLCCGARPAGGGPPCNTCVYVVRSWSRDGRTSLAVEITRQDIAALSELHSIPDQIQYLGLISSALVCA